LSNRLEDDEMMRIAEQWITSRGVTIREIGELVMMLQRDYYPDITLEECEFSVRKVLSKREVQNAVLLGINIDRLAERGLLDEPLAEIVRKDEGLFGCDEILSLGIVNVYGSIGLTNFGYLDKTKPGVVGRLNKKNAENRIHTFLDDIICAIAAAASSRLAHDRPD